MKNRVRLPAFAKINLCLHIAGRRTDGYHELRTVFQAISLHDTLELERTGKPGIHLETTDPALPSGRENLVWRAIDLARRELRLPGGIRAKLTKRIPVARGMGGGSSDAASAMLAVLHLAGKPLPLSRAIEMGSSLGADVPFFLFGGTALGVGRGDELYPLPDQPPAHVVVVSPVGIAVSTRDAYSWLPSRLTNPPGQPKLFGFCALCWRRQGFQASNDFEAPVFRRHPRLRTIRRGLLQGGATEAALAGSGSAVFGLYRDPAWARRTAQNFPKDQVFLAKTLSRVEFGRSLRVRLNDKGDIVARR
ncbi:MAG: 4-(cytidine 5'-diphospho)-2-C-methyl-D-erythritol kinase [Candidatus Acidiferrales bacterium]